MKWNVLIFCIFFSALFSGCRQVSVESGGINYSAGNNSEAKNKYKSRNVSIRREIFDFKKDAALAAVGKISFMGGKWCSLILVSENIAVSAGHCFFEPTAKVDLNANLEPHQTTVIFKPNGVNRLENISIERVLKAERFPDYAIVKLNKRIPATQIKPLKLVELTLDQMIAREERLGCAGFNGDKKLGSQGMLMTISRNIRINSKLSKYDKIETNCFSTNGSSGGLFFEENRGTENNVAEYDFIGVIWGATDGEKDERGIYIEDRNVRTSITPVRIFSKELTKIIAEN